MHNLRNQIIAVIAGILLLTTALFFWLGQGALRNLGQVTTEIYDEALHEQMLALFLRLAEEQSGRYDERFQHYLMLGRVQARALQQFYDNAERYPGEELQASDPLAMRHNNGVLSNAKERPLSLFCWNRQQVDQAAWDELAVMSQLGPLLRNARQQIPLVTASWIISKNACAGYMPNIDPAQYFPPGFDLLDPEQDPTYSVGAPAFNPDAEVRFGKLYRDAVDNGPMVSVSAPVYRSDGTFVAVTGIDIALKEMREEVLDFSILPGEGDREGFAFIITREGQAVAFPPSQLPLLGLQHSEQLLDLNLTQTRMAEVSSLVGRMLQHQGEGVRLDYLHLEGESYQIAHRGMDSTGWIIALVYPERLLRQATQQARQAFEQTGKGLAVDYGFLAIVLLLIMGLMIGLFLDRRILKPLLGVKSATQAIAQGDLERVVDWDSRDEMGDLAHHVDEMRQSIRDQLQRLHASDQQLQSIIDNAPAVIYVKDLEGRYLLVNRRFGRLFGLPSGQFIGHRDEEFLPAEICERVGANDRMVLAKRRPFEFEELIPQAQGLHTYLSVKFPLFDEDGEPYALCGISTDISERKRAETELERHRNRLEQMVDERTAELSQAQRAAEQASLTKSAFLANMSHEIRSPMNGVLTMAEILAQGDLAPEQRQQVQHILRAGRSLTTILNDVLDFSKIEAQQLTIHLDAFSLREVVENVVVMLEPQARDKALALSHRIDADLPEWLVGDAGRIRQVLSNLLSNAIKFTERGTVDVEVRLLNHQSGAARIRFSVRDTGVGVAPDDLERVFDRFVQVEEGFSRSQSGSGLGLGISKGIVELMGGRIGVESTPGSGSRFWFELALPVADRNDAETDGEERPQRSWRILAVDDDDISRYGCTLLLERAGHRVVAVEDGGKALDALVREPFDLVLMDVHMPEMDGLEATRQIRGLSDATLSRIPVIGLTASVMSSERSRYLEAGMNEVLAKPIELDRLKQVIDKVLAQS